MLRNICLGLGWLSYLCIIHCSRLEVCPVWAVAVGEMKSCWLGTKFFGCL